MRRRTLAEFRSFLPGSRPFPEAALPSLYAALRPESHGLQRWVATCSMGVQEEHLIHEGQRKLAIAQPVLSGLLL